MILPMPILQEQSGGAPPSEVTGAAAKPEAQPTSATTLQPAGPQPGSPPGSLPGGQRPATADNSIMLIFAALMAVMVFMWVIRSKTDKRERDKRAQMLANLSKNDRVMTIGGVIGTVVSVKESAVVLKVDESTNTRMTFARRAIQQVLAADEEPKFEEATR